MGEWLQSLFEPVVGGLQDAVGGPEALLTMTAVAVTVASVAFAASLTRRRARGAAAPPGGRGGREAAAADPAALEREAEAAEERGEFSAAVRLRFRAGLVRLARAGVIEERESITTGEVRRALRAREFDELARTFDRVVYGRAPAAAPDAAKAREGWRRLLAATAAP